MNYILLKNLFTERIRVVLGTYLERIRNYLVIELISELVTRTEL